VAATPIGSRLAWATGGAVLAAAPLLVVRVGVVGPVEVPGMPAAESMVRGAYKATPGAFGVPIDLYMVPSDRWLVLTDIQFGNGGTNEHTLIEAGPASTSLIHVPAVSGVSDPMVPVSLAPGSVFQVERVNSNTGNTQLSWVGYLERR
jgi:hypothetical protein